MYEDLEAIAQLRYADVVESVSSEMQTKLTQAIESFAARGLVASGPMEAEKLRIRLGGGERVCRSVYEVWLDLITRRSNGIITPADVDLIMGKVEDCVAHWLANIRRAQAGGITTPEWAAEQADVKMRGVAAGIRRELNIKYREQEAFPTTPTPRAAGEIESAPTRLDPLLNIPDKGAFNKDFELLCQKASAQNPVSIILADVDRFKSVNDSYGYQTGDMVLKEVAQAFTLACANKADVYRWGGEEFAVLLNNYSLEEAIALAERMRSYLANITRDSDPRTITASFGVSSCPDPVAQTADLFQAANDAIISAKRNGRNQVQGANVAAIRKTQTTLTQHALSVFMRTDELVGKLDEEISISSGQPLERTMDASFVVLEKAKVLQIGTVEEIADLIRKSKDTVRKVAKCFVHTTPVLTGYSVSFALDIAAARRGNEALQSYFGSLKLTTTPSAWANEFLETLTFVDGGKKGT